MMDYDNLKQYLSTRVNSVLTINTYSKHPEYATTNDPELNVTEPYCIIRGLTLVEKTSIKYTFNLELEFYDFTANSTTLNDQIKLLIAELDQSWQSESDMFFRIDLDWQSDDIPQETADKCRIDQRYLIQLYNN